MAHLSRTRVKSIPRNIDLNQNPLIKIGNIRLTQSSLVLKDDISLFLKSQNLLLVNILLKLHNYRIIFVFPSLWHRKKT